MSAQWKVWPETLHYKIAKRVTSDFLGSGYVFARKHRFILRFLTRSRAQKYADKLNRQSQ